MSELRLKDIVGVLRSYKAEFGFLDVFATDVAEINQQAPIFTPVEPDQFRVTVEGTKLHLQLFRDKNVARFSLVDDSTVGLIGGALAGGTAGALAGASLDSASRGQSPAGVIFGLLLGGFLGAAAGHAVAAASRPPRQVLTLRYDPRDRQWKVYHGPYLGWAKEALRAE